jgi:hypothetical protein
MSPHAPQCSFDVERSVQVPLHIAAGATQRHAPRTQLSAPSHATSHAPQLRGLVPRSTQIPPHAASPAGHPVPEHAPSTQVSPSATTQGTPQPPQCRWSVAMSTQAPPQRVRGAVHVTAADLGPPSPPPSKTPPRCEPCETLPQPETPERSNASRLSVTASHGRRRALPAARSSRDLTSGDVTRERRSVEIAKRQARLPAQPRA